MASAVTVEPTPQPQRKPYLQASKDLDRIADGLGLTTMQRRFAEALAADPARNQTHAARVAGTISDPAIAGSRWANMPKVKTYLEEIDGRARQLQRRALLRRRDVLEDLSDRAQGLKPTKTLTRKDEQGKVLGTVEEFDTGKMLVRLLDHSEWRETEKRGPQVNVSLWLTQLKVSTPAADLLGVLSREDSAPVDAEIVPEPAT